MSSSPSKKRFIDANTTNTTNTEGNDETMEDLDFEDPFEDEFEEEIIDEDDEFSDEDGEGQDHRDLEALETETEKPQVWRPGIDQLAEGEELEYDPRAYILYHSLTGEWPCLTFDFLKDNLGDGRTTFPLSMFAVTGSQADKAENNKVTILKMSDLHKTFVDESDEESEDENIEEDPTLEHVDIPHNGGVNRIRSMPQQPGIVATMSETGQAHIFDLVATYNSMLNKGLRVPAPSTPAFTFKGHRSEGYALDWSPVFAGRLASGDCLGAIHIWNCENIQQSSSWKVDNKYSGHRNSVEDIQFSPTEATVFSSASSDRTIRIWDIRGKSPQISVEDAHNDDINVISWNRSVSYLLASGCEDGSFKVWDLRALRSGTTVANFQYHKGAISSIEWAPDDESVIALSSADNQLTIWDLSVEAEEHSGIAPDPVLAEYPAQLLFIHQGQHNIKELHHHPQIPGVIFSTAESGFNVFKPAISVSS